MIELSSPSLPALNILLGSVAFMADSSDGEKRLVQHGSLQQMHEG
jgi:hypothetical protein